MNRFIKTTSAFLKRPAVPRNFNKDCCRVTSLRGGETLNLLPQGVHSDQQGNNLRSSEEKHPQVLSECFNSQRQVLALAQVHSGSTLRETEAWPFNAEQQKSAWSLQKTLLSAETTSYPLNAVAQRLFCCCFVPQRENESALEDSLCRFRDICISADSPSDHGSACCASVGSLYPQCCICTRLQGPGQAFYTRGQQTGRFCVTYLSWLYLIWEACGAVDRALVWGSDGQFKPHCSQHVVVSLGKTLHPKLLLWGFPTVLSM